MPDALYAALSIPGVFWVFAITMVAGIVYGFAGFGAALIFMPVASRVLPPEVAIAALSLSALASLVTIVPAAWAKSDKPAAVRMILGAVIATPFGIWLLRVADVDVVRFAISALVLITLAALVFGWRFPVRPGSVAQTVVGGAGGLIGGATGLNGPVVILFNIGSGMRSEMVRANTAVFLTISSTTFLPQLWVQGLLPFETALLGLLLLPVYGLGTWVGSKAFRPGREALYRTVAYVIIATAGISGLPVWG